MPYITSEARQKFHTLPRPQTAGELNYVFTKLWLNYLMDHGGPSYHTFNEIVGAFECAKLELYRKHIVPYEQMKEQENGDVYPDPERV